MAALIVAVLAYMGESLTGGSSGLVENSDGDGIILRAFENRQSDLVVEGSGTVVKVLRDDTIGSPHQRLIVELASKHTVLISHNIDLAPRVDGVREGDRVRFRGEYEWNERGGVIHWTHHDPQGRRPGGWIKHNGDTYR